TRFGCTRSASVRNSRLKRYSAAGSFRVSSFSATTVWRSRSYASYTTPNPPEPRRRWISNRAGALKSWAESPSPIVRSEHLLDSVNRPVRTDLSYAHGEQAIEERVLRRGGLEARQRAQVVVRVVAHARERHVDQRAV